MPFWTLALLATTVSGQDLRKTPVVLAVQRVAPAVVNISSEQRANPYVTDDSFFSQFFRDFYGMQPDYKQTSLGSGVIIDERGYVLTNEHVILRGSKIKVTLADKREFQAEVVGSDPESDLAVLRIQGGGALPAVKMGVSADLMIGETVIAIGNPFGLSHTVTTGIVSALNRSIRTDDQLLHDFIQTDASINPGNSGGPLLNINGDLIGINTAIYENAQGIGFAIPIDRARRIVRDLISYGSVHRAWIGLQADSVRDESGAAVGVEAVEVVAASPAATAGLRQGDRIRSINGVAVKDIDDYETAMARVGVGDPVTLGVERQASSIRFSMKASDFTLEAAIALCREYYGLTVEEIGQSNASRYGLRSYDGMVVTAVDPRSRAARIGIRRGIVLREINGSRIDNAQDFTNAMSRVRKHQSALLMVQVGDAFYRVKL
ncbi:MAG: trypsin-like peptidase domain-containing protein [Acidobacteriota bacterium]